jgi:hypothetical protein
MRGYLERRRPNGRAGLRPIGIKLRIGFRRHRTKRRNQKGRFFSLSPRERVGVRDDQSEKTF